MASEASFESSSFSWVSLGASAEFSVSSWVSLGASFVPSSFSWVSLGASAEFSVSSWVSLGASVEPSVSSWVSLGESSVVSLGVSSLGVSSGACSGEPVSIGTGWVTEGDSASTGLDVGYEMASIEDSSTEEMGDSTGAELSVSPPTVTVTVLAEVTVTVAGPHSAGAEVLSTGELSTPLLDSTGESALLLVSGSGTTVTVETMGPSGLTVV